MKLLKLLVLAGTLLLPTTARAEKITIAVAADLKFAMDEIVTAFKATQPGHEIEVIYGSSGKFHTQIQQGAPYDIYFSADIAYPRELAKLDLTASEVKPYALGRIVLWSNGLEAGKMTLASLSNPQIIKIAIANPKHAPYGKRAEEALRAAGMWDKVRDKLVLGENIATTAQFIQTGNAQVGIIALALALNPELAKTGGYFLIPDHLHSPLEQAFIITKPGGAKPLSHQFADFMNTPPARSIMSKYGFVFPDKK